VQLPALLVAHSFLGEAGQANTKHFEHNFGVKNGAFRLVHAQMFRLRNKSGPLQMSDDTQMNLCARSACTAAMGDDVLRGSATLSATHYMCYVT